MTPLKKIREVKNSKFFGRYYGVGLLFLLAFLFWAFFKVLTPDNFGSFNNMTFYFQSSIIYSVGGCGFYFLVTMGMFDFSIGANVILSAIVGVVLSKQFGYAGLLIGCVVTGFIIGFLNGFLYVKLKIPSMIVTVGLMLIYESVAYFVAGGEKQSLSSDLRAFGKAPANILLALAFFLLAHLILKYTKMGTYVHAIGSNENMAKNMGININIYKVLGFIILHVFVGVMAILSVSYGTSMTAITGMGSMARNFTPLMGCFFGVAFRKYCSPILAIVIGSFIISIIFNGFVALGAPTTIQNLITGAALLFIVSASLRSPKEAVVK